MNNCVDVVERSRQGGSDILGKECGREMWTLWQLDRSRVLKDEQPLCSAGQSVSTEIIAIHKSLAI